MVGSFKGEPADNPPFCGSNNDAPVLDSVPNPTVNTFFESSIFQNRAALSIKSHSYFSGRAVFGNLVPQVGLAR